MSIRVITRKWTTCEQRANDLRTMGERLENDGRTTCGQWANDLRTMGERLANDLRLARGGYVHSMCIARAKQIK